MKISKFEDLGIWQESTRITKLIYDVSSKKGFVHDYGLRDQIRRAMVSVSSNIVEGFEKNNNNELIRFLKISKGSIGEIRNQLYIAFAVGYISEGEFDKLNSELANLANQIGGFIAYLEKKKYNNEFNQKNKFVNPLMR